MRINNTKEMQQFGENAKRQIEKALKQKITTKEAKQSVKRNQKPSRIMRTHEGLAYCPWPSGDPFVSVYQRLEAKYGRYEEGGMLVTEMIIDDGIKDWRYDMVIVPPLKKVKLTTLDGESTTVLISQNILAIESDGFGFHRSKKAFKDDRTKQTHALKQGFVVKRITNEDARTRLDEVMDDIEDILLHPRIYKFGYTIKPKGNTQSIFRWLT